MGEVGDFLDGHLRGKASPFLFVGSGISRRYANTENWEDLLRLFAGETKKTYEYFRTSANGDLAAVASEMAADFHDIWWTDAKYDTSRSQWSKQLAGRQSALKVEIARHLADVAERLPVEGHLAEELDLLRTFPARLLRRLKEHVYQLVLKDDPDRRLFVADIDDASTKDIDVVFGVGLKDRLGRTGYVGLSRWDLINDVVDDGNHYDAEAIVTQALPIILRQPGNVPIYKYLREADMLTTAGAIKKGAKVDAKVESIAGKMQGGQPASRTVAQQAPRKLAGVTGIADLERQLGTKGVLTYGTCLPPSKVDVNQLREFLKTHPELRTVTWSETQFVKLVCYLDWLQYGRSA